MLEFEVYNARNMPKMTPALDPKQRKMTKNVKKIKNIKKEILQNLILVVLEPRDYQNLLGHVI